jgi:hypothetical protein
MVPTTLADDAELVWRLATAWRTFASSVSDLAIHKEALT